jgi:hypothetical protein
VTGPLVEVSWTSSPEPGATPPTQVAVSLQARVPPDADATIVAI